MPSINHLISTAATQLATGSDSAQLDAEILLCLTINKPRSYLRAWPDQELTASQENQFNDYLNQRIIGTPIAYITGYKEFWSRDFKVTSDVLIPRPETELIIELCLKLIHQDTTPKILDLGTGSGIIGITLAAERPNALIFASDFSANALRIARLNAQSHNTKNINFYESDWLKAIPKNQFELIVSNPPYIARDDLHLTQGDLRFEPSSALSANENGLSDIKIIIDNARNYLTSSGQLIIEHGYNQAEVVQQIFKVFNYYNINTHTDLSGQPRVTSGQWRSN